VTRRGGELTLPLETDAAVSRIIHRVGRFEVGGPAEGIDAVQVLAQQAHPETSTAVAAVAAVGGEQAQVIVRLGRVNLLELCRDDQDAVRCFFADPDRRGRNKN